MLCSGTEAVGGRTHAVSRRGLVLYTSGYARYAAFIASEAKQRSSKSLDGATGQVARGGILMMMCLNSICTTQGGLMSSATNLPPGPVFFKTHFASFPSLYRHPTGHSTAAEPRKRGHRVMD